jgi:sirohydrochlorin ferrochelatase
MKTGIVLFAHGSPVQSANDAVHAVTSELERRTGYPVHTGFLECGPPALEDAVSKLVDEGVRRIVIAPYFLTMGIHLKRDLPRIVDELRNIYKGVIVEIADPLDGHPALLTILEDRCNQTLYGGSNTAGQVD